MRTSHARTTEKWTIFCKSSKRSSVSCYTDRLLANQITGKPVRISCHLIMQCELDFHGLTKYLYRLYREIRAPNFEILS